MTGSDHYSYRVYARPEVAESFQDSKFGGAIGSWIADRQWAVVRRFLGAVRGRRVLDVGVGAGRISLPLAAEGARMVGIDASTLMLDQTARNREQPEGRSPEEETSDEGPGRLDLARGDAQALPFPDRAFDAVVCLRVLMHVVDWRRALGELCRVAGERLVFDVPPRASFAVLDPLRKRLLGTDEEVYRTFGFRELRRELIRHGFEIESIDREFVLPIALHRALGRRGPSEAVERFLGALGLRRILGAPATVHARRRSKDRVLMLSPQPYFSPRGTPFSVRHRLEALSALDREVDLVTYHVGKDVEIPGVTIHRIPLSRGSITSRSGPPGSSSRSMRSSPSRRWGWCCAAATTSSRGTRKQA